MKHTVTIDQLRSMPVGQVAALNAQELARLQGEVAQALESAKLTKDLLDGVLNHKYADRVALLRHQKSKDFGTVRFEEDGITVIADLPKRPSWDQKQLAAIVQRIRDAGDDPGEYVETAFKVAENKFKNWPSHLQRTFEPARTIKAGKQVFKLAPKKAEVA